MGTTVYTIIPPFSIPMKVNRNKKKEVNCLDFEFVLLLFEFYKF
jgi:hypothetical protein